MAHRNTVIDPNGVKDKGDPPGRPNALLDELPNGIQVDMSRNNVRIAIANRNERLLEIVILKACGSQKTSMRRPRRSQLDLI
jgi:hypothetical protein